MADQDALNRLVDQLRGYIESVSPSGGAGSRDEKISDFATFFLRNVPYGIVNPDYLKQGAIEIYDAFDEDGPKEPLFWYFRHKAVKIRKALRISYTYTQRTEYAAGAEISASLFIGYQHYLFSDENEPVPVDDVAAANLAGLGQVTTERLVDELTRTLQEARRAESSSTKIVNRQIPDYNELIDVEMPRNKDHWWTIRPQTPIKLDGIFWRNTPENENTIHWSEITNNMDLYEQLIHWEFGGKPYRITKAMLVPYSCEKNQKKKGNGAPIGSPWGGGNAAWRSNLLIGFQGGGIHP